MSCFNVGSTGTPEQTYNAGSLSGVVVDGDKTKQKPILIFNGDINGNGYVDAGELVSQGDNTSETANKVLGMQWSEVLDNVGKILNLKSVIVKIQGGLNGAKNNNDITLSINENGQVSRRKEDATDPVNGELLGRFIRENYKYDEKGNATSFNTTQGINRTSEFCVNIQNKYNDSGQLSQRIFMQDNGYATREVYDYEKGTVSSISGTVDENGNFTPRQGDTEKVKVLNEFVIP